MADYDSDSSADDYGDDVSTNVLLGYASAEPTGDDISQLGGHPTWIDDKSTPDGALAKCKVCNSLMNLLLQINGYLPDQFPDHERRLYIWACRRKACRRKEGSVRGFRGIKRPDALSTAAPKTENTSKAASTPVESPAQPITNLGETLFGVKPSSAVAQANPFSTTASASTPQANPFAPASSLAAKPPQKPEPIEETLPETFSAKARLASPDAPSVPGTNAAPQAPAEPWPALSAFPKSYPSFHIDAETEYISASKPDPAIANVTTMDVDGPDSSSSAAETKAAFESTMDKTFQRFADRLSQNPEQILRYEYAGQPLLYAKNDKVGKLLAPPAGSENTTTKVKTQPAASSTARIPRCTNCGANRVFEMQLTPHAITELEADDVSLDGMDWGTIILAVCANDCAEKGRKAGEVGYVEEWVGVQWEELASGPAKGGKTAK